MRFTYLVRIFAGLFSIKNLYCQSSIQLFTSVSRVTVFEQYLGPAISTQSQLVWVFTIRVMSIDDSIWISLDSSQSNTWINQAALHYSHPWLDSRNRHSVVASVLVY